MVLQDFSCQKKVKSQAIVEYFLAFALIVMLTVFGFKSFLNLLKDESAEFFHKSVTEMGVE